MLVIKDKYRGLVFSISILTCLCTTSVAQPRHDGFFKDTESVNFIGNSITHGAEFHSYIQLYYATRFPLRRIIFYNSGIWGDSANQMLKRMDKDILTNKSDYAVIMAGMNDVNRVLYAEKRKLEPGIENLKQQALADYKKNLEKLIVRLQQESLKIIIQKPSIYDETAKLKTESMLGVNAALSTCCGIIDELAAKHKLKVVDYFSIMNTVNAALQKQNDSATIVSYDRIHPSTPGSFVMAAQFLKETKSPSTVSSISIKKTSLLQSINCKVSNIARHKDIISFTVLQESLPFPVPEAAKEVAELIGFYEHLNQENLKIQGLKKGKYGLYIDDVRVESFSSDDLARGINLANYQTPQFQQAVSVAGEVANYRKTYRALRDIKIVEINFLPQDYYGAPYEKVNAYINQLKESNSTILSKNTYYFNLYFKSKPLEDQLVQELPKSRERILALAKPVSHQYLLRLEK